MALGAEDLRMRYFKLFGEGADEKQAEFVDGIWKQRWLPNLEALLELNGDTGFLVGKTLTHGDIAVWDTLDATLTYVKGATLDGFSRLQRFYTAIRERPPLAAYLASDRRIK
jgi:glutathione S-transferase